MTSTPKSTAPKITLMMMSVRNILAATVYQVVLFSAWLENDQWNWLIWILKIIKYKIHDNPSRPRYDRSDQSDLYCLFAFCLHIFFDTSQDIHESTDDDHKEWKICHKTQEVVYDSEYRSGDFIKFHISLSEFCIIDAISLTILEDRPALSQDESREDPGERD